MDKEIKEQFDKALKDTEAGLRAIAQDVKGYAERGSEEIKRLGTISAETSGQLKSLTESSTKLSEVVGELKQRLVDVEQKGARAPEGVSLESNGEAVTNSPQYKAMVASGEPRMSAVAVKSFGRKAAIVSADAGSSLVVPHRQAGIFVEPDRELRIRDLLPTVKTSSSSIEYPKEVVGGDTDWVGAPQYASPNLENVAKKELKVAFDLENEPVRTIAGWIPASRQILADAAMLGGYINTRLTYGVGKAVENQLLSGSGAGGDLNGLLTQAEAYAGGESGDTMLDTLLRGIAQVAGAEYSPTGAVISKTDWYKLLLIKDEEGRYIFGDPAAVSAPRIWGLNTVATAAMSNDEFLIGAFAQGTTLFDREQTTVRIAEQHADFFVKNMVVILGEERLALVVYSSKALVSGEF